MTLQPRTVIIGVFVGIVLPLWVFFAWALGLVQIGEEKPLDNETPVMIEATRRPAEDLARCLWKNHSQWLPLTYARSPYRPANTRRLRSRPSHVVIDVVPRHAGSELRVYKLDGSPLARAHVIAVQACIPEYGLPAAADPRNDDFYRALLNNSAVGESGTNPH